MALNPHAKAIVDNFTKVADEVKAEFVTFDQRIKKLEHQIETKKKALLGQIKVSQTEILRNSLFEQKMLQKMKHRTSPSQMYADLFSHSMNPKKTLENPTAVDDFLSMFNKETEEDVELHRNVCIGCNGLIALPPELPKGWKQYEPSEFIYHTYFYNEGTGEVTYEPPPNTNRILTHVFKYHQNVFFRCNCELGIKRRRLLWHKAVEKIAGKSNMNIGITDEELEQYRTSFDLYDIDKGGTISMDELQIVMKSLGASEDEIQNIMKVADINGDGEIDMDEYMDLLVSRNKQMKAILLTFQTIDVDGSGQISKNEFMTFMRQLDPSLTDNEISEMINGAEMDGDGEIDIDEFKAMTSQYIINGVKSGPEVLCPSKSILTLDKALNDSDDEEKEGCLSAPQLNCVSPILGGKTSIILDTSKSTGQKLCKSLQQLPSICLSSCEFEFDENGYVSPPKVSPKMTSFVSSSGLSFLRRTSNSKYQKAKNKESCGSLNLYNMTKSTNYRNALMKQASIIHQSNCTNKPQSYSASVICMEEKRNKSAIIIQALVRRFLCLRNFDMEEVKRIERRMVVQADALEKARQSVVSLSFTPHIRVNFFRVISRDICKKSHLLNTNINPEVANDILLDLFSFVNPSDEYAGTISRLQCHYLIFIVLNCPFTDTESYKKVNEIDRSFTNVIHYETFLSWYLRDGKTPMSIAGQLKRYIYDYFSQKKSFLYRTDLLNARLRKKYYKVFQYQELSRFDEVNPPRFRCRKCNKISSRPLELVKHVVKCTDY